MAVPASVYSWDRFNGHFVEQNVKYRGTIKGYEERPFDILRPFFEHVWNECGLKRPDVEVLK